MTVNAGQTGGCQCGAVRYRLLRDPVALYACHCRDCQKQSASAFGLSMWVERDALELSGAGLRIHHTRGGSGADKDCAFCGACGTRIYHANGEDRGHVSVKAGTLDDTAGITPTCHLWTDRAQPWLAPLLEGAPGFAREPDSDETLVAQWRALRTGSAPGRAPDPRELVRSFYARVWEAREPGALAELAHEDLAFRGSLGAERRGHAGFLEYVEAVHAALGDYRCTVEDLMREGDRVCARMTFSGVHRGELLGCAPTGRRVAWAGCAIFTFRDGRIADLWVLGDVDGLKAELDRGPG